MKKYGIMLILLLLTGCYTPKIIKEPVFFDVPTHIAKRCPDIELLQQGANAGTVLAHDNALVKQYTECATSKDSLIELAKPSMKVTGN